MLSRADFHGRQRLKADLRGLQLTGIRLGGSVDTTGLRLPEPRDTVIIHCTGGISDTLIKYSGTVPITVCIRGGASRLTLDFLEADDVGSNFEWAGPDYATARDRYRFEFDSGADGLRIVPEIRNSIPAR